MEVEVDVKVEVEDEDEDEEEEGVKKEEVTLLPPASFGSGRKVKPLFTAPAESNKPCNSSSMQTRLTTMR